MKKTGIMLAAVLLSAVCGISESFADEAVWQEISQGKMDLKTVLVQPDNPRTIYVGLKGGIFKTEDSAKNWRPVISIRGKNNYVNLLALDKNNNNLFAGTGGGLYRSDNQGRSWNRAFKGRNDFENECTSIAVLPYAIYLGTKGGLFISRDKGRSWHKAPGEVGNAGISCVSSNYNEPNYIYAACAGGVFKSVDGGLSWEKVFVINAIGNNSEEEAEESNEEAEEEKNMQIRYLLQDPTNLNLVYAATSGGVYISRNRGKDWESIPSYGLLSRDVRFLRISRGAFLYAVTKSGIFEYRGKRWYELSSRLVSGEIRYLDLDNKGNLYAACDNGLFMADKAVFGDYTQENMMAAYYKDEPGVSDVQKAAIKYAEVEPEKIARWRKQSARRAFLPKVSAGLDRDTSDLWHWESGSTTKSGDDILTRGRDSIGWDLTLSWDLGELIWNESQTSIDVRSRLMVQLRDDILDEVNKLYFERLRVKMELDNLSIEDRKRRLEKELRLKELAASLDALTGGYFSKQLKDSPGA